MSKLDATRRRFSGALVVFDLAATLALLAMMALTFVDVICRYVFNAPITGATMLIEVLLVAVIFFGLPAATRANEHIAIDLIDRLIPGWLAPIQARAINAFCGIALALLTWRLWLKADYAAGSGETTVALAIPTSAILYPMAVLTAVVAAIFIVKAATPDLHSTAGAGRG